MKNYFRYRWRKITQVWMKNKTYSGMDMLFKTETLAMTLTSKSRATEMRWGSWLLSTFSSSWKSLLATKIVFNIIIRFSVNLSMIIPANFRSPVNTRWHCRMEESKLWRTVSGQRPDMWWVLQFNFETTSKVFFGPIENYMWGTYRGMIFLRWSSARASCFKTFDFFVGM